MEMKQGIEMNSMVLGYLLRLSKHQCLHLYNEDNNISCPSYRMIMRISSSMYKQYLRYPTL